MTTLVSAVYGGYDQPRPLPWDHGFDAAVLVTDAPAFVAGWDVVVDPRPGVHPRRAAKDAKCLPWDVVDDPDVLWLDGAFEVLPGLRGVVDEHLAASASGLVAWRHPSGRVDAYQEADFSRGVPKYQGQDFGAQIASYAAAGMPDGWGLWEVGMLARRRSDAVEGMGEAWLAEVDRWGVQDQVAFPFAAWSCGLRPDEWRGSSHWDCGWVRWHSHRDES